MTTIPRETPGRPRSIRRKAELLIGSAGVNALYDADLFLISGALARELALIVEAPPKAESLPETTTQPPATSTT